MDKIYATDLTDDQWAVIEPLIPPPKRGGRPRRVSIRLVLNTIFYLTKTGCQWHLLPTNLARPTTANGYFTAWKADGTWQAVLDALRRQVRVAAESSSRVVGRVGNSIELLQAICEPGRPWAPLIRRVSMLTLKGGQPKKGSHGS